MRYLAGPFLHTSISESLDSAAHHVSCGERPHQRSAFVNARALLWLAAFQGHAAHLRERPRQFAQLCLKDFYRSFREQWAFATFLAGCDVLMDYPCVVTFRMNCSIRASNGAAASR